MYANMNNQSISDRRIVGVELRFRINDLMDLEMRASGDDEDEEEDSWCVRDGVEWVKIAVLLSSVAEVVTCDCKFNTLRIFPVNIMVMLAIVVFFEGLSAEVPVVKSRYSTLKDVCQRKFSAS